MFDKYFTPQEAEELIPMLERMVESIRAAKRVLDTYDAEFEALSKKIQSSGGMWIRLDDWTPKRLARETAAGKVVEEVEKLQSLGVFLKDFELGLVDLPSHLGDEEVFLCWKTGESRIQYWHLTTERFIHRKPLVAPSKPPSSNEKESIQ